MKPPPHENPDLTAYALGELHARQARDIHALLSACPVAAHELEQVEAVTDALRQGAPIPQERLRPEQGHAVLYPANLPRRMGPMMPRPIRRRPSVFWPIVAGVLKAAAVIALTGAAYWAGRHTNFGDATAKAIATNTSPEEIAVPEPVTVEKTVVVTAPVQQPKVESLKTETEKTPVVVVVDAPQPKPTPVPAVVEKTPLVVTKPAPVMAIAARPLPLTTPGKHLDFVNASRQPVDQFALIPSQIRPLPAKVNKRQLLAAPAPLQRPAPEAKETTKLRTPDLFIHSWKADIASSPWNEGYRLLRLTIQLPADQPAATTPAAYPLRVAFDPNNVREYRQLCERHQLAAELRHAGTHVIWYEFLPNGNTDADKIVATMTLDKGRFTTQTVGPFDSSKLNIQDRGQSWTNAREDFVFDSAVVGFGLLMRGLPNTPKLDHNLVLSLAEKSKGADLNGERARFIELVNEAAQAAGL